MLSTTLIIPIPASALSPLSPLSLATAPLSLAVKECTLVLIATSSAIAALMVWYASRDIQVMHSTTLNILTL